MITLACIATIYLCEVMKLVSVYTYICNHHLGPAANNLDKLASCCGGVGKLRNRIGSEVGNCFTCGLERWNCVTLFLQSMSALGLFTPAMCSKTVNIKCCCKESQRSTYVSKCVAVWSFKEPLVMTATRLRLSH